MLPLTRASSARAAATAAATTEPPHRHRTRLGDNASIQPDPRCFLAWPVAWERRGAGGVLESDGGGRVQVRRDVQGGPRSRPGRRERLAGHGGGAAAGGGQDQVSASMRARDFRAVRSPARPPARPVGNRDRRLGEPLSTAATPTPLGAAGNGRGCRARIVGATSHRPLVCVDRRCTPPRAFSARRRTQLFGLGALRAENPEG